MRRLSLVRSLTPALAALVAGCADVDAVDTGTASFGSATLTGDSSGGTDDSVSDSDSITDSDSDSDSLTSTNPTDPTDPTGDDCADGDTRPCYSGPGGTQDVGMCMGGTETCEDGMWSGMCVGESLPGVEACNTVDDDCDGIPDDGIMMGACVTGMQGICSAGTNSCAMGQMSCEPNMTAQAEVCGDGIDQNCNGLPDDGCMACPYVYGHDGRAWTYEGAVGGASLFGRPEHAERGRGKRVEFAPLLVRLEGAAVQAGTAKAKLLVAEDEIAYVDRMALAVVEHPAGTEVIATSSLQWGAAEREALEPFVALPIAAMRTPVTATWRGRVDVTEAIGRRDARAVHFNRAGENFYELDFGAVQPGAPVRLVIDGWKLKEDRALRAGTRQRRPFVQIQRKDGAWHTVMAVPSPRGDRKTVCIDLSAVAWDRSSYRVRLWTGTHEGGRAMWYVDRARLCTGAAETVRVHQHEATVARLGFDGVPTAIDPADHAQPRWNTPDGGGALGSEHRTFGRFTRYGDVAELLRGADDHVVVMRRGDAIDLSFDGIAAPAAGAVQTLWLHTELVYKPRVMPGLARANAFSSHVEPMPHRAMGHYRAGASRTDAAYLAYLERWNTRVYDAQSTCWGEPAVRLDRTRRAIATALHVLPLAA